ncbi:DUF2778 domain-containing protein [Consotaella salsifontis]|uniref:Tlde1 domain-containing protein n=1 Tax=Consotaella salsifontis TaxID=1365950 RepID=A0A1T4TE94_9HYPH|nr:DUF2778 domain-containing protein [Consotaella salsifontis]SKA38766.1 Protein of unknown function [Consotaella salsifontis]
MRHAVWAGLALLASTTAMGIGFLFLAQPSSVETSQHSDGAEPSSVAALDQPVQTPAAASIALSRSAPSGRILEEDRGSRVFHGSTVLAMGESPAERGGRVTHRFSAAATERAREALRVAAVKAVQDAAQPGEMIAATDAVARRDEGADGSSIALALPVSAPLPQPEPVMAPQMASLESGEPLRPGADVAADDGESAPPLPTGSIPHPSFRALAAAEQAIAMQVPQVEEELDAVAVPTRRPNPPQRQETQLASLEPQSPPAAARQQPPASRPAPAPALAYARPDAGAAAEDNGGIGGFFSKILGGGSKSSLADVGESVAVYDISSATVHMPDGTRLEAHSGLGHMKDNPRYVDQKNRGPTPPNVYNLQMRRGRFHGAEAIRLLPADGRKKFNRDGLLAHPYMYVGGGSRSQSNGCVVFNNYPRFLEAFKRGKIKKMIVVKTMDDLPTYVAAR